MEREVLVQDKPVLSVPVVSGGIRINDVARQLVDKLADGTLVVNPDEPVSIRIPK